MFLASTKTSGKPVLQEDQEQYRYCWCILEKTRLAVAWIMDELIHFSLGSVLERQFVVISTMHKVFIFLSTSCCFSIIFLSAAQIYTHQCTTRCQSWSVLSDLFCTFFGPFCLNIIAEFDIQGLFLCWLSRDNECCLYMHVFSPEYKKVLTFKK